MTDVPPNNSSVASPHFPTWHFFTLSAFAVAWPLFDLLSRHPGFLVAHRAAPRDIVALVLLLSLGVPLVLVLVEVLAGFIHRRLQWAVHLALVALLVTLVFSWLLSKFSFASGAVLFALAVIGGIAFSAAYQWLPVVRSFVSVVTPAVLIFPAIFVTSTNISKLLHGQVDVSRLMHKVDATAPVVMVIFDEFPTASLLDARRRIDPAVYPNFARLAADSTWFRGATSVHQLTGHAVPAILTGNYQDGSLVPTAGDHPYSLFTLLGGSYELKSFEAFTQLCPQGRFGLFEAETFTQRLQATLTDLSVVSLHVLLPRDLTAGLPSVSQTWRDFLGPSKAEVTRDANKAFGTQLEHFHEFLDAVAPSDKPQLLFAHIFLPHQPWVYLPDGRIYMPPNALYMPGYIRDDDRWGPSRFLVDQAYQRHLLQVRLVDNLLGQLIDKLKALDLYDPSLIVVTADHGVSFWPNQSRRNPAKCPPEDILGVPLLIKAPDQHGETINDRNVETIDILPTIADLLDIKLPWKVDGASAVDPRIPERPKKRIMTRDAQTLTFDADLKNRYVTLDRKLKLFGPGPEGLWRFGPHQRWIGRTVESLPLGDPWNVKVELVPVLLQWAKQFAEAFVPSLVAGTFHDPPEDRFDIAFAVNGTVQVAAPCFHSDAKTWFCQAMVPGSAYHAGDNPLELFAVTGTGEDVRFHPLTVRPNKLHVSDEAMQPVFSQSP